MMDWVTGLLLAFVLFLVGATMGNLQGDQATLRDCATRGEAKMAGGGTVKCEVKREQP